ncbi:hypothetical protein BDW02DRAFT_624877 [Decorospora gaudefroyi]|uniref:Uncharacterized protein n=1 Tax=Decorospora gaudefroyi TaxID=184978 RepID=A0A6A5KH93_9PLEO|nr:hypothetical protein BDW02DRAFT_624877 [Decorospora gaudefroyi]
MFITTLLLFFLLSSPTLARGAPQAENSSKRSDCLEANGPWHITISFQDSGRSMDYAIVTQYKSYYPTVLQYALQLSGFQLKPLTQAGLCGWRKAKSVYHVMGIDPHNHRGDIYWKEAVNRTHVPTITGSRPDSTALDDMVRILKENEPAGDVYELSTIILAHLATLMAFILLMLLIKCCAESGCRREPEDTDDAEGVELNSMKTHGMVDVAEGTDQVGTPKSAYGNTPRVPLSSTDTLRLEVLPMYSLD